MSTLLWQKGDARPDDDVQRYLAGADVELDRHLVAYDVRASVAHVRGLGRLGVLDDGETARLVEALEDIGAAFARGELVLDDRWEDGHTALEALLGERLGELGRKVHLGRSRNDQVLVAQRMLVRDVLAALAHDVRAAARACLDLAAAEERTVMPGYTHLQRAVPSTAGLWMAGFAEAFVDDAALLASTVAWMDACPLGTAAGYGVNVPLDRAGVAKELGFARVLVNPVHAQNGRGQREVQALAAAWQPMQTARRLAWDLGLYASAEFGFVRFDDALTTGSSIMPNKRNPDLVELVRAAPAVVAGAMAELQQLLGLPSGYHRDLQLTKGPTIRGLTHAGETMALVPRLVTSIELDRAAMRRAIDADMHATDRAVELALSGEPFRDAYRRVASEGAAAPADPDASVAARVSPGACADLRLDEIRARLDALAP